MKCNRELLTESEQKGLEIMRNKEFAKLMKLRKEKEAIGTDGGIDKKITKAKESIDFLNRMESEFT